MVKPFLLKCHPDVQPNPAAKQVNLAAIQNLNSYLETLQVIANGNYNSKQHGTNEISEIDFVLQLESGRRGVQNKNQPQTIASRRRVELLFPPRALCRQLTEIQRQQRPALREQLSQHGIQEITKLLKVAGLEAPSQKVRYSMQEALDFELDQILREDDDPVDRRSAQPSGQDGEPNTRGESERAHFHYQRRQDNADTDTRTEWEKSRDRFTANIQWQHYDRLRQQALESSKADLYTRNLYEKNPLARRKLVSRILARIRIDKDPNISVEDQLIAFRRLSILFQTNFRFLQLDTMGNMWERANIILTAARNYNLSPTALRKRRLRDCADSGFVFKLHADTAVNDDENDNSDDNAQYRPQQPQHYCVSIYIPMDFGDDELIQELDRNVWDLYDITDMGGMDDLFPEGFSKQPQDLHAYNLLTHQAKTTMEY